ncbi:hypothetical protein Tco_0422925 [Tanacetum coccineum]
MRVRLITGKALDADLVVTESSGTKSEVQDDSSRLGNDTDVDVTVIRPSYDEESQWLRGLTSIPELVKLKVLCLIHHLITRQLNTKTHHIDSKDFRTENICCKLVKECSLNSETKDVHAIKYKMSKAKERCMAYFRSLHSHLQVLSKDDLKGTRIEHGFKWAFMSLFGQDVDTFTRTTLLNVDQL